MVAGVGVPTLLLHGYTDISSWRGWEKNIDALSQVCRVYAFDLLGYGESDKPGPRLDTRGDAKALTELIDAGEWNKTAIEFLKEVEDGNEENEHEKR